MLDRPEWSLVRPDPVLSVVGELATLAIYASDGGRPERLADPAAAVESGRPRAGAGDREPDRPRARRPTGTRSATPSTCSAGTGSWRRRRPRSSSPNSSWSGSTPGRPLGGQCPEASAAPPPADRLIAVYPVGHAEPWTTR